MLKAFWNWLTWQFYKGNADKLLAESQAIVGRMDAKQKLGYAMNAAWIGSKKWIPLPSERMIIDDYLPSVSAFMRIQSKSWEYTINQINQGAIHFQMIAQGKLLDKYECMTKPMHPIYKELAYAFWSLQRMLAIAYPNHGFKLEGKVECSDSEALTSIVTSIVASVAAAYGHERGCRAYVSVYRAMIDYGKGLVE